MRIKVPSKTVDCCDVCKRESTVMDKCVCCGKDYCYTCRAIVFRCIHQPEICKQCGDIPAVLLAIQEMTESLCKLLKARDSRMKAAYRKARKC